MADQSVPSTKLARKPLTAERARELLRYDPETGSFFQPVTGDAIRKNGVARWHNGDGYIRIRLDGRKYLAHRLAWLMINGSWPAERIDHRNGKPSDNRWCNLRAATATTNKYNSIVRRDSSSQLKGASKNRDRWKATIQVNGKSVHLGLFDTPEEAHAAYCAAAQMYHGEFANVGHITDEPE